MEIEKYLNLVANVLNNNIIKSLIVIIVSLIIYKIVSGLLLKSEKKNGRRKVGQKDKTYIRLIRNFMKYAFFIIVVFTILQINGIDVSSMVAGVGVLSIIIGFIVQDAFKDIIRGIDIISDNYFAVGDVVKYGEIEGKVLMVGLKTTKIQDVKTLNIISIANRNIEQVEILSKDLFITIPMPYDVKVDKAESAINDILKEISKDERIEDSVYKGVNKFAESNIDYLIGVKCNPIDKLAVRRDILRIILVVLNKHKIEIPYQQIDIHTK
ncbi:MAG: mechanosensitive ion channel family protein [Clostridia bacterium]|nr:mechanosensitive ion channel family protein [Clostridia bacterium]